MKGDVYKTLYTVNQMNKRIIISLITGAILGVFCIIGATTRYNETVSTVYLFAFWFNRLVMGLVIGLADKEGPIIKRLIIGAALGLFISFAFYSATEFFDLTGFLVGAIYGLIIVAANVYLVKTVKE